MSIYVDPSEYREKVIASSKARTWSAIVASPGPPCVSTWMMSKILSESMKRKMTATRIYGHNIGKVRLRNVYQKLAPSTAAASNGARGKERSPASTSNATNGV